jgi:hypothetical protein
MHPHEIVVLKGMAVAIGEGRLGCSPDMGEDEGRDGLGRETFQVLAVPGWEGGSEDARFGAEFGVRVPAYAEAVAVDGAASVLKGNENRTNT